MKIRMLSTAPGSVDGIRVATYEGGAEYDLSETAGARELAAAFVDAGLAEDAGAKKLPPTEVAPADGAAIEAPASVDGDAPPAPKPGRKPKAQ
jgi:hypothetical protein